jgi:hypothetical protein
MSLGNEMRTQLSGTLRVGYYVPVTPAFISKINNNLIINHTRVNIKLIECDTHSAQAGLLIQ